MIRFGAIYKPISLFSLKDSNSTNSGAKSLFVPSPYAIKMALINQAILCDGIDFNEIGIFETVRDTKISYYLSGKYCVNNCFIKILKAKRDDIGFQETVAFREYLYISKNIIMIFEVAKENWKDFWQTYLYRINYFGKRGCFFQFISYLDDPPVPNVIEFNINNIAGTSGIIQQYDDFDNKATFKNVNNYSSEPAKRKQKIFVLPLAFHKSSKNYTSYYVK